MWHSFWLWVYINAQTIEAACAVLAFFGLVFYAFDTRQIRYATLAQSNASRRPYFHPEDWKDPNNTEVFKGKEYYQFRNCGAGIAVNISWRFLDDNTAPLVPIGSCAVRKVKFLFTIDERWIEYSDIEAHGGVRLEYEDTAGMRYWTTITLRPMADESVHALVDTGSAPKWHFMSWFLGQDEMKEAFEEFRKAR